MSTIDLLTVNLCLLVLYMTLWFWVARKRNRLDTVDSAWGGGFALAAWSVAIQAPSARTFVIALLITIWSGRLTSHIASRSRKHSEDPRYVAMAEKWKGSSLWTRAYVSIFLTQGVIIWIVSLPVVMVAGTQLAGLDWLTDAGAAIWLAGFIFESVADKQLANFLAKNKAAADKKAKKARDVLDTGLWRYSRHPNYFGELVQWWAIAIIALQAARGWVGLLGPLLLTILIIFISGIPPIEKRRQNNAAYQDYKKRTSALIPLPPHA